MGGLGPLPPPCLRQWTELRSSRDQAVARQNSSEAARTSSTARSTVNGAAVVGTAERTKVVDDTDTHRQRRRDIQTERDGGTASISAVRGGIGRRRRHANDIQPSAQQYIIAKFHYTDPTGPERTFFVAKLRWVRAGRRQSPCGSGRVRVMEFSSNRASNTRTAVISCKCPVKYLKMPNYMQI